jgi:hypothetical protein
MDTLIVSVANDYTKYRTNRAQGTGSRLVIVIWEAGGGLHVAHQPANQVAPQVFDLLTGRHDPGVG